MTRINVIMPVTFNKYEGQAKDVEGKFERAVKSFTLNKLQDKRLIIVSDGCNKALLQAEKHKKDNPDENIIVLFSEHTEIDYSGKPRNKAIEWILDHEVKGIDDVICYLDFDDEIGDGHLYSIHLGFDCKMYLDWAYFDDVIVENTGMIKHRAVKFESILGTSNFAHRSDVSIVWGDGYGHDRKVTDFLKSKQEFVCEKIKDTDYRVRHYNYLQIDN